MRQLSFAVALLLAGCCSGPAERPVTKTTPVATSKPAPAVAKAPAKIEEPLVDHPSALVSIDCHDADLKDVVDSIARQAGVNIVCEPQIHETVTLRLRKISWMEALQLVAQMTKCEVNVLRDGVYYVIDPPKVTLHVD